MIYQYLNYPLWSNMPTIFKFKIPRNRDEISYTVMSQIRLYEYMFQMWRIHLYALCIRTFNHIWNMYSYNRIWEIVVLNFMKSLLHLLSLQLGGIKDLKSGRIRFIIFLLFLECRGSKCLGNTKKLWIFSKIKIVIKIKLKFFDIFFCC
jgi:hypothetical protein